MRVNIYTGEGVIQLNRTSRGGTVLDFVQLITEPTVDNDAATKLFVDTTFGNLDTSKITTGTINASTLPSVSGDLVSNAGTNQLSLKPIITAGEYVKVVVNGKGLVTGSAPLVSTDIPDLAWSKITTDLPTTVVGYGITDAIDTSGGNINVNITLSGAPTQPTHAVTKAYADTAAAGGGGGGLAVGDIMLKLTNTTPAGFLRCNGAMVSKTTYASLYASITDALDNRTVYGSGKPWQQQYQINSSNAIAFTASSAGTALSATTASAPVVVTKNKVFKFGGTNGSNISTIQTAAIADDGTVGTWSNLTLTLPSAMKGFQVVTTKNYVYVLAGVGSGNSTNFIYRSPIDASGNLGSFTTDGTLPAGLSGHAVILTASYMYVIGGSTDGGTTAVSTVYKSPIGADGSLGTWTAGPALPINLQYTRTVVTKGRVYLMGGHTGTSVVPNLIYGTIDATGVITSWTASSVMPVSVALGSAFATTSTVYYLGGTTANDLSSVSTAIYSAPINVDGSIGSWTLMDGSCPVKSGSIISVKNNIYVFGGQNAAGTYLNSTIRYATSNLGAPNDVSSYYTDVVFSPSTATDFKLPDLSINNFTGGVYYVKY